MHKHLTFNDFLKVIHNMTMSDYYNLNDLQKKALWMEYTESYK